MAIFSLIMGFSPDSTGRDLARFGNQSALAVQRRRAPTQEDAAYKSHYAGEPNKLRRA
jgi:hypothetical protein